MRKRSHTAALWGLVLVQLSVASIALPESVNPGSPARGNSNEQQVRKPGGAMTGDAQGALGAYAEAVKAGIQAMKNYTDMERLRAGSDA